MCKYIESLIHKKCICLLSRMTDRPKDPLNNILDGHLIGNFNKYNSASYLEYQPRKSHFPHTVPYRQTDGHFELYGLASLQKKS